MKAKFKVNSEFRLKADNSFQRTFPRSRNRDGTVGGSDQVHKRAGSIAKITGLMETSTERSHASYDVDFGDTKLHLTEPELLKLFEPV